MQPLLPVWFTSIITALLLIPVVAIAISLTINEVRTWKKGKDDE